MSSLVSAHGLSFAFPDGTKLFDSFTFHIGKEKVGLVGKNGLGKTTLLKLILKEIEPPLGSVIVNGKISYLPQKTTDFDSMTLLEVLGVSAKLKLLKKAEEGTCSIKDLEFIAEDWNLPAEIGLCLSRMHLSHLDLNRLGSTLSGGEMTKLLLARVFLEKPDLIICDEPTNNLDKSAKIQFMESIQDSKAGFLIVSHDRQLLNKMDKILEISNLGLKIYGGNYEFYLKEREKEDEAALHKFNAAVETFKKQKTLSQEIKDKQSHKNAHGEERALREGMSRIEMKSKVGSAQKTTARLKDIQEKRLEKAGSDVDSSQENLREKYSIQIDVEKTKIPQFKEMIICKNLNYQYEGSNHTVWENNLNIEILGNKRIAIIGDNGSGKTTFINLIMNKLSPSSGEIKIGSNKIACLDQKCSLLNEKFSILENMKNFAPPDMKEHEVRIRAGRFLFYGDEVFKLVSELSGGERLRVALACLLAINNAPDIFILDEPTNNLDLDSIEILASSINNYSGTLIVISHDDDFLNEIKIEERIYMEKIP